MSGYAAVSEAGTVPSLPVCLNSCPPVNAGLPRLTALTDGLPFSPLALMELRQEPCQLFARRRL